MLCVLDEQIIRKCKIIRNNIHYTTQETVNIGDEFVFFNRLLELVEALLKEIGFVLNINYEGFKLTAYRFLRWVQE